jgi:hypothetical protein
MVSTTLQEMGYNSSRIAVAYGPTKYEGLNCCNLKVQQVVKSIRLLIFVIFAFQDSRRR